MALTVRHPPGTGACPPMDAADLARVRDDTPGIGLRVHLNNAGAALMPSCVLNAMKGHLDLESRMGGYEAAALEEERLAAVYSSLAHLVGARPEEIAIFPNATTAWQMACYALPFSPGDRILTARAEYAANLVAYTQIAQRTGATVEIIPDRPSGETDPTALEAMINDRVKLVSITWVASNGGLVNPVAEIGAVTRPRGIPFLVDACQAVGQMAIDVQSLGCDMLTAAGRKFLRGPRGTGFLYVRGEFLNGLEPPMLDHFGAPWTDGGYRQRPDARRFETWERNIAAQLGLGSAADYALAVGMHRIEGRCRALSHLLRDELRPIPGVMLHDLGQATSAIVSMTLRDMEPDLLRARLQDQGINVHVSKSSSTPIDARQRGLTSLVRISPHYYNSEFEIGLFIDRLKSLARQ